MLGSAGSHQKKEASWPCLFVMQAALVMDVSEKAVPIVNMSECGEFRY